MSNPIMSAIEGMSRPPQLIRIDKEIPLDVGATGNANVEFVVHSKDEFGTTLRIVDIRPAGEGAENNEVRSGSPRTGSITIIPSPSA